MSFFHESYFQHCRGTLGCMFASSTFIQFYMSLGRSLERSVFKRHGTSPSWTSSSLLLELLVACTYFRRSHLQCLQCKCQVQDCLELNKMKDQDTLKGNLLLTDVLAILDYFLTSTFLMLGFMLLYKMVKLLGAPPPSIVFPPIVLKLVRSYSPMPGLFLPTTCTPKSLWTELRQAAASCFGSFILHDSGNWQLPGPGANVSSFPKRLVLSANYADQSLPLNCLFNPSINVLLSYCLL